MLTIACTPSGNLIDVVEVAALPKHERPSYTCFACERNLIPRLGTVIRHHFAHPSNATCYAAGGEGVQHLEAKLHVKRVLEELAHAGRELRIERRCLACRSDVADSFLRFGIGDQILVERQWNQYRPDIMVKRGEQVQLVLEIVVTHACTDEKWALFSEKGVPALEVPAHLILAHDNEPAWDADGCLPVSRELNIPPVEECPGCTDQDRERIAKQRQREQAEARRWNTPIRSVEGIADAELFFQDGRRHHHRLILSIVTLKGEVISARLSASPARILASWRVEVSGDLCDYVDRASVVARDWALQLKRSGAVRCKFYGGFQMPDGVYEGEDQGADDRLHEVERAALREESYPASDCWWYPREERWVRCYHWNDMEDLFPGVQYKTLGKWAKTFRKLAVEWARGRGACTLYEAKDVERFQDWLKRSREEKQAAVSGVLRRLSRPRT